MIIKNKARDTTEPAEIIRSRPVFFFSCFGVFVVFSKSGSGSKVVVSDSKKENYIKKPNHSVFVINFKK